MKTYNIPKIPFLCSQDELEDFYEMKSNFDFSEDSIAQVKALFRNRKKGENDKVDNVIRINGFMQKNEDFWSEYGFATSTKKVIRQVTALENNKNVDQIVFMVDSGGGMVDGMSDLSETIASLKTPTVAYVDGMSASACYYAIASCDKILSSKDSSIGSIGAIISFATYENYAEKEGITPHYIRSKEDKARPQSFEALRKEDKTKLQNEVNAVDKVFTGFVNKNRNFNEDDSLKATNGQIYNAKEALKLGLIDGIINPKKFMDNLNNVKALTDENESLKVQAKEASENVANLSAEIKTLKDSVTSLTLANEKLQVAESKTKAEILVDKAIQSGKIPTTQRDFYVESAVENYKFTEKHLEVLTAVVPVGAEDIVESADVSPNVEGLPVADSDQAEALFIKADMKVGVDYVRI